ncbi:hypothetical protein ALC57_04187, partial [Trachymyrmex cornetzi]
REIAAAFISHALKNRCFTSTINIFTKVISPLSNKESWASREGKRQSRNLPFNKSDHRSRFRTCRFARPTFLFSLKWAFNFPRFKEKILNFSVKINSIKYVYYKERQYNIV